MFIGIAQVHGQGSDFTVDGGLSKAYVTALGEPALPPPASLTKESI